MCEVGDVTNMFHLGEGLPPGVLKSRILEQTELAMPWIVFLAHRRAPSLEKVGLYLMRISASFSRAGCWIHAVLTEFDTVSSSGQINPARHRIRDGIMLDSKGNALNVIWGTDQTHWDRTVLQSIWEILYTRKAVGRVAFGTAGSDGGDTFGFSSGAPTWAAIISRDFWSFATRPGWLSGPFLPL